MLLTIFDDQASRVKAKTSVIYTLFLTANGAAWAWAWTAFAERPALLGTALLAYLFGLRHAFDADHIAAIDNVARKLTQEGKAPCSAGFFFSLGHSTVVFVASVAIAATAAAMPRQLDAVHDLGAQSGQLCPPSSFWRSALPTFSSFGVSGPPSPKCARAETSAMKTSMLR
jgi:nickel/cobalt transporter (NiCoT) family protein